MTVIFFILVNTLAAFFQSVVGFGQGVIASPLSLTLVSTGTALSALLIAGLGLNFALSRKIKEPLDKNLFIPLFVGSLLGMPVGIVILKVLSAHSLEVFAGSLSILLTLAVLFMKLEVRHISRAAPIAGFLAGILQTSISIPSPPVVVLLTSAGVPKDSMRKILITFFLATDIVKLLLYIFTGVLTKQGLLFGLLILPFVMAAGYVGNKMSTYIPHKSYKVISLVTISITSMFTVFSGLG